jgi:hypothetical protein
MLFISLSNIQNCQELKLKEDIKTKLGRLLPIKNEEPFYTKTGTRSNKIV